MREVYSLSTAGGADSPRFRRYRELNEQRLPLANYNPMTSNEETPATVDHLLGLDAEGVVAEAVGDFDTFVSVLTPGAWTDHAFTTLERTMSAAPDVAFWAGETPTVEEIATRAAMAVARRRWQQVNGEARTLRPLATQEGIVGVVADAPPPPGDASAAEMVLEIAGDTHDRGTLIAWLMGDEAAEAFGDTGVGLAVGDGLRYSYEWAASLDDVDLALETGILI